MIRAFLSRGDPRARERERRELNRGRIDLIWRFSFVASAVGFALAAFNRLNVAANPEQIQVAFLVAHLTLGTLSALAALFIFLFRHPRTATAAEPWPVFVAAAIAVATPVAYAIWTEALNAELSGTVAAYLIVTVGVGYVVSLPLLPSVAAFGGIHLVFILVTVRAQPDQALRAQALIDGSVAAFVATHLSFLNHRVRRGWTRSRLGLQRANAQKDQLISLIAHDLRAPIIALGQSADVLARGATGIPPDRANAMMQTMAQTARETLALLDRLIQWARAGSHGLRASPRAHLVANAIESVVGSLRHPAEEKQVEFEVAVAPDIAVRADAEMLDAVLRNLLMNALKYSRAGGRVTVTADGANGMITLRVIDEGIGMTAEQLESAAGNGVYRPHPGTSGERGVGIGLQIVRELLSMNGGELELESEPDRGTIVTVRLPQPHTGH